MLYINMSGIAVQGANGRQFTYLFIPNFYMHINGASPPGWKAAYQIHKNPTKLRQERALTN